MILPFVRAYRSRKYISSRKGRMAAFIRGLLGGMGAAAAIAMATCAAVIWDAHGSSFTANVHIGWLTVATIRYGPAASHVQFAIRAGFGWWLLVGAIVGAIMCLVHDAAGRVYTRHIHNLD